MDSGSGMGMGMGGHTTNATTTASLGMAKMQMVFHSGGGDALWIGVFKPTSPASILGASVVLFLLGIISRFLDAVHRTIQSSRSHEPSERFDAASGVVLPFQARTDVTVGVIYLVHSALAYLLMLAVMTANAYYFVAIVVGLGFGEAAFGRFGRRQRTTPPPNINLVHHSAKESPSFHE